MIDAVGMEAHGSGVAKAAQGFVGLLPDAVAAPLMERAGVDRLAALLSAIEIVRRGGTLSISGVYGGMIDPLPMLQIFDKQLTMRHGSGERASVGRRHHAALGDDDPLGVEDLETHRVPLRTGARSVRDVPEEGGRRDQGRLRAVTSEDARAAVPAGPR